MSAKALLDRNPHPTEDQIKEGIANNICRCTGYVQIVEAIQAAARTMKRPVKRPMKGPSRKPGGGKQ
jgi:carbon-monoxide dehydrogenase small subunit